MILSNVALDVYLGSRKLYLLNCSYMPSEYFLFACTCWCLTQLYNVQVCCSKSFYCETWVYSVVSEKVNRN